jgi:hypothetical protein
MLTVEVAVYDCRELVPTDRAITILVCLLKHDLKTMLHLAPMIFTLILEHLECVVKELKLAHGQLTEVFLH